MLTRAMMYEATGCFFYWSNPKSVENGKIAAEKVKVGVKTSHLAVG